MDEGAADRLAPLTHREVGGGDTQGGGGFASLASGEKKACPRF